MTAGHHHCDYRRVKVLLSSSIVCIIAASVTLIPRPHQAVPLDSVIDYHHLWQEEDMETGGVIADYVNDNPVIEVDDNGVPVCPPAINHPEACYAKVCRSDIDCLQLQKMKKNNLNKRNNNKSGTTTNNKNPSANDDQDERVCCYNGCVRTCMIKVKPPPFFDYDINDHHQDAVTNGKILPAPVSAVAAAEATAEFQRPAIVLTLPGGCHLTQEQYDSYQKFQIAPSIRQCYCLAGDVFCQINNSTSLQAVANGRIGP